MRPRGRPVRDRRPRRRRAGGAERQRPCAGGPGRCAARAVRAAQRDRARLRRRLARAGRALLAARDRACAGAGRRAGPRRLRPAAQGAQLLDGRLARSVGRRRRAVPSDRAVRESPDRARARARRRRDLLLRAGRPGDRVSLLAGRGRPGGALARLGGAAALRLRRLHIARAAAQRPGRDRRLGAGVAGVAGAGRPGAGAGGGLRAGLRQHRRRHRLRLRGGRRGHGRFADPEHLLRLRLPGAGARLRVHAAEPRRRLRARGRPSQPLRRRASGRSTRSSRPPCWTATAAGRACSA